METFFFIMSIFIFLTGMGILYRLHINKLKLLSKFQQFEAEEVSRIANNEKIVHEKQKTVEFQKDLTEKLKLLLEHQKSFITHALEPSELLESMQAQRIKRFKDEALVKTNNNEIILVIEQLGELNDLYTREIISDTKTLSRAQHRPISSEVEFQRELTEKLNSLLESQESFIIDALQSSGSSENRYAKKLRRFKDEIAAKKNNNEIRLILEQLAELNNVYSREFISHTNNSGWNRYEPISSKENSLTEDEPLRDKGILNKLEEIDNRITKGVFDIVFSFLVVIFILSWLIPILAVIIKLDSRGPVFFKQLRLGENNKPFYCFKLRSVKCNTEGYSDDKRVTSVGKFLRKTKLDELPKFFNVFLGNMSLVGPTALMLKHEHEYSQLMNRYMVKQFIKPGLTGWAQIHGYRVDFKRVEQLQKKVEYDIEYMENWNMLFDLKIIVLTLYTFIRGDK